MIQSTYEIWCAEIERKREEMIFLGNKYGLNSLEVIRAGQQLNNLLNQLCYLEKEPQQIK